MLEATFAILILLMIVVVFDVTVIWLFRQPQSFWRIFGAHTLPPYFPSKSNGEKHEQISQNSEQEEVIGLRFWPPQIAEKKSRFSRICWSVNWLATAVLMPFSILAAVLILQYSDLWISKMTLKFFHTLFIVGDFAP